MQGVFYRQSTQEKATQLGLMGWVQNLPNGDVMACVAGEAEQIAQLESWLKIGPPAAQVTEVKNLALTSEEKAQLSNFIEFKILR